jgi:hypothetical protein
MRAGSVVLATATLLAACTDSCACGNGGEAPPVSQVQPSAQAGVEAVAAATASDAGDGVQQHPAWSPAPDSELTRKLTQAKAALETDKTYDKLATDKTLGGALADKLGAFEAEGPAAFAVREGGGVQLPVSARSYRDGDKTVRIKVTDTGQMPSTRRVVSGRLTMIGNDAVGNERGLLLRDKEPAVTAYFEAQRASRASAVIAGRYLVQVMVNNTDQADDALRVLERIDPKGFK